MKSLRWEQIGIIFNKEVLDNTRDRRTLANSLLLPLLGPFILAMIVTLQVKVFSDGADSPIKLPVVGANYAPHLVEFLRQNSVVIQPAPTQAEAEVQAGKYDAVLVIPQNYGESFTQVQPATIQLIIDQSRTTTRVAVNRIRDLITAYSRQIGVLRLLARGVSPSVLQTLAVEDIDVATPQSREIGRAHV